jgi:DNA-binding winged helix-turn-helix (wHTH) protein
MEPVGLKDDAHRARDGAPRLEEFDLLYCGDDWVALSANEAVVVRLLVDNFGRVVGRKRLTNALWPIATDADALLNQLVVRVRRRIEPLGLEVGTVRGRGYVLRFAPRT